MRKIKFRALIKKADGSIHWIYYEPRSALLLDIGEEVVVGNLEYTGKKDRNGIEIYEGDYLKSDKNIILYVRWSEKFARWEIVYDNKWAKDLGKCIHKHLTLFNFKSKVIGNLWENPNLFLGVSYES